MRAMITSEMVAYPTSFNSNKASVGLSSRKA